MRVVGVHGVGNYRAGLTAEEAAAKLSQIWARHLAPARDTPLDVQVAYYAHHLRRAGAQGREVDDPSRLDPEAQAMVLAWVGQLGAPDEIAQGRVSAPLRQALSWVADRYGLDHELVRRFVARFFREVMTFFREPDRRAAARDCVADLIATHAPRAVLAHSLGSVVAYEALWAHSDLRVDLLITLGSPLGMSDVVFDRLDPAPEDRHGTRPPGVTRCVNLADPGDLVAIPRPLTSRFTHIDADEERTIHAFDFHRAAHYLASPTTHAHLTRHAG